jgi:RNA polymerase sigma-70 factor (ECF subfamily)
MTGIADDLGNLLRQAFGATVEPEVPPAFERLLAELRAAEGDGPSAPGCLTDDEFQAELLRVVPHLRSLGRSLAGAQGADDLAQQAMMRAWRARSSFARGTNMRAWTARILRNEHLTQARRGRWSAPWNDAVADKLLVAPAGQGAGIDLADMQEALARLPEAQREALILVGANGLSYDEAAALTGCAPGTVKSRVSRARASLEAMLTGPAEPQAA